MSAFQMSGNWFSSSQNQDCGTELCFCTGSAETFDSYYEYSKMPALLYGFVFFFTEVVGSDRPLKLLLYSSFKFKEILKKS
jgi:hypothetical protein